MMLRGFVRVSWLAAGLAPLTAVLAGTCDIVNKSQTPAEVTAAGKSVSIDVNAWLPLPECADLEVLRGPVQVRGVVGGRPEKRTCDKGPCPLRGASKSLAVAPTSSYRDVPGGHRMDKDTLRKAGIPKGEIYDVARAAQFNFSALPSAPATFVLWDAKTKNPLLRSAVSNDQITIPSNVLQRGGKYGWDAYGPTNQKIASGGFNLMTEQGARAVEQALAATGQAGVRPAAEQALDELEVLYSFDLTYEIEVLRRSLGAAP